MILVIIFVGIIFSPFGFNFIYINTSWWFFHKQCNGNRWILGMLATPSSLNVELRTVMVMVVGIMAAWMCKDLTWRETSFSRMAIMLPGWPAGRGEHQQRVGNSGFCLTSLTDHGRKKMMKIKTSFLHYSFGHLTCNIIQNITFFSN